MSGGMKAVIWTDCLQSFVMMFSMIFLSKYFWPRYTQMPGPIEILGSIINTEILAIQLWTHLSAESIIKISNESNGHQMFEFNLNIFQRTSSFGFMMMEFMFISTRVAFGQYFMQRCVAMKTLSQVSAL